MNSSAGAAGRQLLSLMRALSEERDPEKRRSLRRREIGLLASMGQTGRASGLADSLVVDWPDWPVAHAVRADLSCRTGDWPGAEREFTIAAELLAGSGRTGKAARLMLGPVYRIAEAAGKFGRCLELCSVPDGGSLAAVLEGRAARLLRREKAVPRLESGDDLADSLAALEDCWRGRSPEPLVRMVDDWGGREPEWRWRVLVEGVELCSRKGIALSRWRKPLRRTAVPVLDPRFEGEMKRMRKLLGAGGGRT